jgi:hypothetical protein
MYKAIVVLALALSGCAGVMRTVGVEQNLLSGHRAEVIEPGDWQSPVTHLAPPVSSEPTGP